eukprot:TRINITY_DN40212_c1_g1_i1.p6 TRINITY_DN40212_c1_g1~~TRINITY_DN40212_c1_g1_i1.p6  ORF type:complete len:115 (-),score=4.59 TRINITY_DN40212_c1_g1_i1:76-420(-)
MSQSLLTLTALQSSVRGHKDDIGISFVQQGQKIKQWKKKVQTQPRNSHENTYHPIQFRTLTKKTLRRQQEKILLQYLQRPHILQSFKKQNTPGTQGHICYVIIFVLEDKLDAAG